MSERELFENCFYCFYEALKVMADDADVQCEKVGNYNVAWELIDDVSAGASLLEMAGGNLTNNQKNEIKQLLSELKQVPESVLLQATTHDANLDVMSQPCWKGIRQYAAMLIKTLEPAKLNNEQYFNS